VSEKSVKAASKLRIKQCALLGEVNKQVRLSNLTLQTSSQTDELGPMQWLLGIGRALDILINNAGLSLVTNTLCGEWQEEAWDDGKIGNSNLKSCFNTGKAVSHDEWNESENAGDPIIQSSPP